MAIWFKQFTPLELNQRSENTLADYLGIEFTAVDDDSMTAIMPVAQKTKQPIGILHGGANVVLSETIASTAANAVIDLNKFYCVGLEINANHLRSVTSGNVMAITRPIHLGKMTQIWTVDIFDDQGRQTCISRMTAAVIKR
ncbi:MAG: hotdog fold thioesterase [Legionella sp.]